MNGCDQVDLPSSWMPIRLNGGIQVTHLSTRIHPPHKGGVTRLAASLMDNGHRTAQQHGLEEMHFFHHEKGSWQLKRVH